MIIFFEYFVWKWFCLKIAFSWNIFIDDIFVAHFSFHIEIMDIANGNVDENSQHNGNEFDESFNLLCSSLGLQKAENELKKADMFFAELKKLRQKSAAVYCECAEELQKVKEAHLEEKIKHQAELEEKVEALQFHLAKMSNELKNAKMQKDTQKSINEKFESFLSSINERKF